MGRTVTLTGYDSETVVVAPALVTVVVSPASVIKLVRPAFVTVMISVTLGSRDVTTLVAVQRLNVVVEKTTDVDTGTDGHVEGIDTETMVKAYAPETTVTGTVVVSVSVMVILA